MKSRQQIAIQLKNVTKTYQLRQEKPTFVEHMLRRFQTSRFTALDNVNLTIYKGEKIGIVGPNGSGKTTLLKLIAGITTPDQGQVITNGKVVSLIDLTAGFHPELTGIENIYLNGLVIGMNEREITEKLDDIIRFADIGQFIYQPLFTYSEGMKLRLGFSTAIHADPSILLLDETITAGDQDFRAKSLEEISKLLKADKTVLLASHWTSFMNQNFKKQLLIEKGNIQRPRKKES